MKKIYYKKLIEQLEIAGKQNIVFWGASLFLEEFINENALEKYNILGIIDNDSQKWGKKISNYTIYPPLKIQEFQPVYIVFSEEKNAIKKHNEISNAINCMDCNKVCIFPNIFEENYKKNSSNHIYLIKNGKKEEVKYIQGLDIEFRGENSIIEIVADTAAEFINCRFELSDNSYIKIGDSSRIRNLQVYMHQECCKLTIGKDFFIRSGFFAFARASEIEIGDSCMFSSNISLRTADGHTIIDNLTKKVINKYDRKSIQMDNHVWLGYGVSVLKNTKISSNTIVGVNSTVNKKFDETNIILAGTPARIIKRDVNWDHRTIMDYEIDNNLTLNYIKGAIKNKKVLLWGASIFLENLLKQEKEILPNILGIIDKDAKKWGKDFYGYKIISPKEIEFMGAEAILVTIATKICYHYDSIKKEVEEKYPSIELLPNIFEEVINSD